ncbi:hypothetical protein [Agarivorans sp. OAG1]|uniref:hypothetical protein n=1 Tax=Agarivorans sp. OAG1 TaxID=3082387 RepID=UPI0030CC32D0
MAAPSFYMQLISHRFTHHYIVKKGGVFYWFIASLASNNNGVCQKKVKKHPRAVVLALPLKFSFQDSHPFIASGYTAENSENKLKYHGKI